MNSMVKLVPGELSEHENASLQSVLSFVIIDAGLLTIIKRRKPFKESFILSLKHEPALNCQQLITFAISEQKFDEEIC